MGRFPMWFPPPPAPHPCAGGPQGIRAERLTGPGAHQRSVSCRMTALRLEGPQLYQASSKYQGHQIDFSIWGKKPSQPQECLP